MPGDDQGTLLIAVKGDAAEAVDKSFRRGALLDVICQVPYDDLTMDDVSVLCRSCGEANPEGQRFCGECGCRLPIPCPFCGRECMGSMPYCSGCGTLLPGRCPACTAEVTRSQRFCAACGSALPDRDTGPAIAPSLATRVANPAPAMAAPATQVREERRLITALFCDLVGFTPLSERLDPEQVRELQTEYFQLMSAQITRYGGTVEKFAGDAVLALFGVPVAHEDDAQRAVRCALSMHNALASIAEKASARWGTRLALRVGVNTGEAVSGMVDAGDGVGISVVTGDVVNTAARLQTAAEPGGTMVGAQTMQLSRRDIEFGPRQELTLKGKSSSVVAYPVASMRDRKVERWETGQRRTRLVGRERELDMMLHAWHQTQRGHGQFLMLVADAGVGKSRLLAETVERAMSDTASRELRGRCLSHGQSLSLSLIAGVLRSLIGVREQDDPTVVRAQLVAAAESHLAEHGADALAGAIDVLGEVLGLEATTSSVTGQSAQVRRQALIKSVRHLLAGVTSRQPTILVLEDLHWIDGASADVLAEVLPDTPEQALLVLAAQRPGRVLPWSNWRWVECVTLRALDEEEATSLATAFLGDTSLSEQLRRYVVDRAGGNPFYIEELLEALQEEGGLRQQGGEIHLVPEAANRMPATLTEIVLARLDRLDETVRRLVQVASVIGRAFAVDLLAHIVGKSTASLVPVLDELPRADIAFPRPPHHLEYVFKHVTVRDVAYHTLLVRRRQELHAAAAQAIERLYPGDEYVEVVAYHYAMSEDHRRAAEWLERAGDRAANMYANEQAINHYEEARKRQDLAGAPATARARVGEKLGRIFRVIAWYDEALEEIEAAAEVYRTSGDLEGEARAAGEIAQIHFLRGAWDQGIDSIQQVVHRLDRRDERAGFSRGLTSLFVALVEPLSARRRFAEALEAAGRAVELAEQLGDEGLRRSAEAARCRALQGVGRIGEARELGERVLVEAKRSGDTDNTARILSCLGDIAMVQGHPGHARECFEAAMQVAENRGDLTQSAYLINRLGRVLTVLGEWRAARAYLERSVELVRSMSYAYFSASAMLSLGEHYLMCGETEQARRYLEEPFTISQRSGGHGDVEYLQIPLAARDVFLDRPREALDRLAPLLADPAFDTTDDHQAMQIAALARLALGNRDGAAQLLESGLERACAQGNRFALPSWRQIEGLIASEQGRWHEADRALEEAHEIAREMPYPMLEASIWRARAELYRKQGLREGAVHALQTARDLYEQLGAVPFAARARAALEELSLVER